MSLVAVAEMASSSRHTICRWTDRLVGSSEVDRRTLNAVLAEGRTASVDLRWWTYVLATATNPTRSSVLTLRSNCSELLTMNRQS